MLYEVRNLKKSYGDHTVLDLEHLALEAGQVVGLLGPNGAGKTTLLEILSFLSTPSSGQVWFNSSQVDYRSNHLRDFRREVVIVPQTPVMFTTSVYKNVEFGLKVRKTDKTQRTRTINEALERVGLQRFGPRRADRLSGGETQRVAIARALACGPKVIFFDEPTANVDVENQAAIENIIESINRDKGISIVLTTHNMIQAAKLAHRTIFLFEGRQADSIYENIFTSRIEKDENQRTVCRIQEVVAFPIDAPFGEKVKVAIDPRSISVSLDLRQRDEWSLSGRIRQISDEGREVRILVDVGLPLTSVIDTRDYQAHPLPVGAEVMVRLSPGGIGFL